MKDILNDLNNVERVVVDMYLKESIEKLEWRIECIFQSEGELASYRGIELIKLAIQLKQKKD